ncbi:uracil-DNA glycosylase [Brevundimonas sp.]|uniref:uracil-DNA glycosylase n=1 Tax=Brevundimonas sp. TaxID=1871086 RepID=UPI0028A0BE7B|nr:uracil-DNA glycosylase [Brevundimonas sp.]
MNTLSPDMLAYESLLAFWRDAGVDACYLEEPFDHTKIQALPTPAAVQKLAAVPVSRGPLPSTNAATGTADARQLAMAAQDMDALVAAVGAFDGCGLKKMGARSALFGRGASNADLLVIGDAPNDVDDARGAAFSSPAGQLMDRILAAAQLTDRAYLTQTVFWQPPGNRPPTPEEQAVCLPFIERAVQLLQPKAVLLVGSVAARGILASEESLLKLQGRWKEWTPEGQPPLPVMTTFHPGFLLQQPQAKGLVWRDMLTLKTRLEP